MANNEPVGKPADRGIWAYDLARRWHRVPDPLPPPRPTEDFDEWLRRAGYWRLHDHGHEGVALRLAVYEADGDDGAYLVAINTASRSTCVMVPDLPSLLQLLGELLPVVEASMRLEAAEEEHERKMKLRRPGGVYNAAKRCTELP
jgi:hypothetical protein